MNPRNWCILPHLHDSYRKLPSRFILKHLRAGISQEWDWAYYCYCSGESLSSILLWMQWYAVAPEAVEAWMTWIRDQDLQRLPHAGTP
jgi:hypothetical protein